jgi:hypothetical protein
MRLGQLARKLALRPADIVEFLAEKDIRIADGTNVRLENDHVNLIMKRFVPGWIETLEVEPEPEEEVVLPKADSVPLNSEQVITEDQTPPDSEPVQEQGPTDDTNEVIRAAKIELSGLKVLGKIDLPELKKKEDLPKEENTVPEEAKPEESKRERREVRRPFDVNKKRYQHSEKNPIALQREREAKEAQKKFLEQEAREKEKRTQKYLQNYKPSAPTKATKLVKEDVVEMTPQDLVEPPKTIFGKIMRWLTKAS